jgi:hypothetical protein
MAAKKRSTRSKKAKTMTGKHLKEVKPLLLSFSHSISQPASATPPPK